MPKRYLTSAKFYAFLRAYSIAAAKSRISFALKPPALLSLEVAVIAACAAAKSPLPIADSKVPTVPGSFVVIAAFAR